MRTIRNLVLILIAITASVAGATAQTSLQSLSGERIDVAGQKGKVVILALGASWLPLSGKQAEFANTLAKRYAGKSVVVYFVATDSTNPRSRNFATNQDLEKFATTNKLTVTIIRDSEGAVTLRKFNVDQLPSFVILDKQGAVVETFGGIDPKFDVTVPISKAVDKLL